MIMRNLVHFMPRLASGKEHGCLTLFKRKSNSLVPVWVGSDQWQEIFLNPEVYWFRLSLCYESVH